MSSPEPPESGHARAPENRCSAALLGRGTRRGSASDGLGDTLRQCDEGVRPTLVGCP